MRAMQVYFEVKGEPKAKQRARTTRNKYTGKSVTYTPDQTVLYENYIKVCYAEQCGGAFLEGPLCANIGVHYSIPRSASKSKRNKMLNGELYPTKKPDVDNVAKTVLDALNKIAYHDDSQIVSMKISKVYSDRPMVAVRIWEERPNETKDH